MEIGLDCDDVLFDYAKALVRYYNSTHDKHIKLSDLTSFDSRKTLRFPTSESYALFKGRFERSEIYRRMQLIKGAREGVSSLLQKGHSLHIITSRSPIHSRHTIQRLHEEFPGSFIKIHFTHSNSDFPIPKVVICKEQGIELIIDDNPETIIQCIQRNVPGIIFDRPWNRDPIYSNLPKASSWYHLDALIN